MKFHESAAMVFMGFLTCSPATQLQAVPAALGAPAGPAAATAAPPPATAEADPTADRLTFLTLRLSSAEESLKAIDGALKVAGYKSQVASDKVAGYQKGNELMNRNGGGPVPWDQFYGKTARAFATPWNDPIRRPKQFNYLYKANNDQAAKAKDEVASLGRKIDALLARRKQLQLERVTLWATIAMESIGNREMSFKPLYRLPLGVKAGAAVQPAAAAQIANLDGMIAFIKAVDASSKATEDGITADPGKAFANLKQALATAHHALQESMFNATQVGALPDADARQLKEMAGAAKHLDSLSQNIADAFDLARQSEAAGDDARKQTLDGVLQESLLGFADAANELDDSITNTAKGWGIAEQPKPAGPAALMAGANPKIPAAAPAPAAVAPAASSAASPAAAPVAGAASAVQHGELLGHGEDVFVEDAPAGAVLVGFEFSSEKIKGGKDIIKSARAIYRGPAGEVMGKQLGKPAGPVTRIAAKPGYAVGAIAGSFGAKHLYRLTLRFVRVNGNALVPTDAYDGPVFGNPGTEGSVITATKPVIGIRAAAGLNLEALGLVTAQ